MLHAMFRWIVLAIAAAAVSISAFHRWRAYRAGRRIARRMEGPAFVALRLLVALPLYGSLAVYAMNPSWLAWASWPIPDGLRLAAAGVGVACLPAIVWTLRSLGTNVSETVLTREGQALVEHGPYASVRHPLYTFGLTLLFALAIVAASAWLLALSTAALVAIRWVVIPREERELRARFGAAYVTYAARTGRFWPRTDVRI
jgi:protein-S-isoprenylcysteine O-methyltransferase Ste14